MIDVICIVLLTCVYLLTAIGSTIILWEFHLEVNGLLARKDIFAKLAVGIICLFWPSILFVSLINKSLRMIK